MRGCVRPEKRSYMLLWLASWWADWLALEDFSYSLSTHSGEYGHKEGTEALWTQSFSRACYELG